MRAFTGCDDDTSLSVTAILIGAVAISRTLDDDSFRARPPNACERDAMTRLSPAYPE